jgi:hypothetical protein
MMLEGFTMNGPRTEGQVSIAVEEWSDASISGISCHWYFLDSMQCILERQMCSSVHIVILAIVIVLWRWRWLLLLQ